MSSAPRIDTAERRRRLAVRHRLVPSCRTDQIPEIAGSLVSLHASDPASVYLSCFARMHEPTVSGVSAALYVDRSVVRHHGMRRTIWVYEPATARWVHAACTAEIARKEWAQLAAWASRSGIEEVAAWAEQIAADTLAALHRLGPSSARQLGKAVPELTRKITMGSGKYTAEVSAHSRVLVNLAFDATIVRTEPTCTWLSSEYTWRAMDDWLPEGLVGASPTEGRAELARAYLRAFGPVTMSDLQWWAGWSGATAKAALASIGAVEVSLDDGISAWITADDAGVADEVEPWAALLPSLDPTAMGWKERKWYLGEHTTFPGPLFDRNGNVGPTVWADGRVVGGWAQRADGSIVYELLDHVDRKTVGRIDAEVERAREAIGSAVVTPRFPTPLQKQLAAS